MTNRAIAGQTAASRPNSISWLTKLRGIVMRRARTRRKYHQILDDLNQYSARELVELGISRYDVERVARGEHD